MSGHPRSYTETFSTLKEQIGLLKSGDNVAVFTDGASIAVDGDHIHAEYQLDFDDKRAEQKAKRQGLNS